MWRRLRRLGVAHLGDGLVGLPHDARTREHLEWVAALVEEAGGAATLWRAQTLSRVDERQVAGSMAAARAEEYADLASRARDGLDGSAAARRRVLRRLRSELRTIQRRDYFPPPEHDLAAAAVDELAARSSDPAAAAGSSA